MVTGPRGDAPIAVDLTGSQGTQVGAGNIQHNTFYLPAPSITWPRLLGRVPALADTWQRRPMDDHLAVTLDGENWGGPARVIAGMGGVGKTQLAAAVARELWDRMAVDLLVWVTATSREAVVSPYAAAATAVTGRGGGRPPDDADYFLAWLAHARAADDRPVRWLVVLDDIQRPSDLRGLWPPTTAGGATLATTRRRDAALTAGRRVLHADVFTPAESIRYLTDKLAAPAVAADEAAGLADDLGHLPLALAQAATYILDRAGPPSGMTCARYRRLLANRRHRLGDLLPTAESLPDEHASTVAATWSLSIEHADELPPPGMARQVLEIAALLDPNGIPVRLLTAGPVRDHLRSSPDGEVSTEDVEEAIHTLHRLSLVTITVAANPTFGGDGADLLGAGLVKFHALAQRAVRESTEPRRLRTAARSAADALLNLWPQVERQVGAAGVGQLLRANADSLRAAAWPALCPSDVGVHPVLFRAGNSLGKAGLVAYAFEYFDSLATAAAVRLGAAHRDVLTARRERARWQGEAGDQAGAVTALQTLLPDVERALGADHHDAMTTRNELAWLLGDVGDADVALRMLEDLVLALARSLGPDHYDTLLNRHDLAGTWRKKGDPARAGELFAEMLPDCLRVLGPINPLTLRVRHALAWSLGEAGDPAAAVSALTKLLPDRIRAVGPYDPGTLSTRYALGHWRGEAGDPARAASDLAEVSVDCIRTLGPDHPITVGARESEALWRGRAVGGGEA